MIQLFLQVYAINTDPHNLVETSLGRSAELMQEVSTWQHILCTQLTDGVLHPLTQQLNAFSQLQQLREKHLQCNQSLEAAMTNFLKTKRKDSDSDKQLAVLNLTDARRNFHQCSVLYYNELNLHQAGRQLSFLTPLLALVAAHQCFHSLAHAALNANHNKRQVELLKQVMNDKKRQEQEAAAAAKNSLEQGEVTEKEESGEKHDREAMEVLASDQDGGMAPIDPVVSKVNSNKTRIPRKQDEDYFEALGLVVKRLEVRPWI